MIITYIPGDTPEVGLLKVEAPEILDVSNDPSSYEYVIVTGVISSLGYMSTEKYLINEIAETDNKFWIIDGIMYVSPIFFNLVVFSDDIVTLTIKLKKIDSWVLIQNCTFIDITYKCKVATLLDGIITESRIAGEEGLSTIAHLLHYALINGGNCGCNCSEMEQVFNELKKVLINTDPKITNDCGC